MRKKTFRFALMLLALAAAFAARLLLEGRLSKLLPPRWLARWPVLSSLGLGCGLLLGALFLFGLVAPGMATAPTSPRRPRSLPLPPRESQPDARIIRPAWMKRRPPAERRAASRSWLPVLPLLAAAGSYGISLVLWSVQGETLVVRFCWLAGIALLLLSQLRWSDGRMVNWSVGRLVNRSGPTDEQTKRPKDQKGKAIELALLALILVAAFGLRFYRLEVLPFDMHGDMASHAFQARELLYGTEHDIWKAGWASIPMFGFLPSVVTLWLFGDNLFGLRMASVIEGTLSVLGLYLLARELYGRRVALLAASFLTISYAHIHFSRIAEYVDPLPWVVFAFYFLARGFSGTGGQRDKGIPRRHPVSPSSRRRVSIALGGVLMALGIQTYHSSRVMLPVVALWLLWLLLTRRGWLRARLPDLMLLALAFLMALGPMLLYTASHWRELVARNRTVSLLNPQVIDHLRGKYGVTSVAGVLQEQVRRSLLMFHRYGDNSTHFSLQRPMVDLLTATLLTLGLGYALLRLRQKGNFLFVSWLLITMVLGSMLTNDPPYWPHLVGILLPAAALAALGLDRLWAGAEAVFGQGGRVVFASLVIVALVGVGVSNWQLYYDYASGIARPRTRIGRYLAALPAETRAFIVEDPFHSRDREIRFLVGERPVADVSEEALRAGDLPTFSGPAVFIITPNHSAVLEVLRQAYPGGASREHREPTGYLAFFSYEVPG